MYTILCFITECNGMFQPLCIRVPHDPEHIQSDVCKDVPLSWPPCTADVHPTV